MRKTPYSLFTNNNMPQKIKGNILGSWANYSICRRLPDIADRIIGENHFSELIENEIHQLKKEIPFSMIKPIMNDCESPDFDAWHTLIKSVKGLNWLETPWFFVEFYFYRRILEITHYFCKGPTYHLDPYQFQKDQGLKGSNRLIDAVCNNLLHLIEEAAPSHDVLSFLIYTGLRGNQFDLSLWPNQHKENGLVISPNFPEVQFVIDQTASFIEWFASRKITRVDFIIDNAGFEFLCDLLFADYLLSSTLVAEVVFHVKPYPIFVSDVIRKDVTQALHWMSGYSNPHLVTVSKRLREYLGKKSFSIKDDIFWGMPLAMWEMPKNLYKEFSNSQLIISKGDANYRRLLGDRAWPLNTGFDEVVSYLPNSLLVLRMLKSEVGIGYSSKLVSDIQAIDNLWMQNGKWGSIQFYKK